MPIAILLLREKSSTSLTTVVEKSQLRKPPLPEYNLQLQSCHLNLIPVKPERQKFTTPDEGFESDIDTLSIISSDDSFTVAENVPKTETDSANGSSSSESEDADATKTAEPIPTNESYNLVNCICYSDVKFPDLLVFVIQQEALVFKFLHLEILEKFYTNFNTLKAVTNQKAYGKTIRTRFNLLQRTDNNGVTHIEISRQPHNKHIVESHQNSKIISINTPDVHDGVVHEAHDVKFEESPKKLERRKKLKGKAPPPPIDQNNVLKGEYVRFVVPKIDSFPAKIGQNFEAPKPKLMTYQEFKTESKKLVQRRINADNWTNSIPRTLNNRSRSETRNFTPMAYRYIDTCGTNYRQNFTTDQISNRLFGLSSKLRDFGTVRCDVGLKNSNRWNSLSELGGKIGNGQGSLKSVIKKEDNKRKNEKKVTFSAYTTVQVV